MALEKTIERQIAQMFMPELRVARYISDAAYSEQIRSYVTHFGVGGFIIFEGTLETIRQVTGELQSLSETPLFFSADLEPGLSSASARIADGTSFPHAMAIGRTTPEMCELAAAAIAEEARSAGININFAPVCDVNNNPLNPIINIRSFGETPQEVSKFANAFIKGTKSKGVMAVAKHFPGHGDTEKDSHLELPRLTFPRARFDELEFVPFIEAIKSGVGGIMIAHLLAAALDETYPATLSRIIVHDLLRNELGFTGLTFTDALIMHAIADAYTPSHAAMHAVIAGCDVLLMPEEIEFSIHAMARESAKDVVLHSAIKQANERISYGKSVLPILGSPLSQSQRQEHEDISKKIVRDSISITTSLKIAKTSNIIEIDYTKDISVVLAGSDKEVGNMNYAQSKINEIVDKNGLKVKLYTNDLTELKTNPTTLILMIFNRVTSYQGNLGDTEKFAELAKACLASGSENIIGVSLGNPYIWHNLSKLPTIINCFSNSRVSIDAVINKLFTQL